MGIYTYVWKILFWGCLDKTHGKLYCEFFNENLNSDLQMFANDAYIGVLKIRIQSVVKLFMMLQKLSQIIISFLD